jgi:hypothetical protein
MIAHDSTDRVSTLSGLGLLIACFGLLFAVVQGLGIVHEASLSDQSDLLATLCWIAIGATVVMFGMSLIILGQKKWE